MDKSQVDFLNDCLSCHEVYSLKKDSFEFVQSIIDFLEVYPRVVPELLVFELSQMYLGVKCSPGSSGSVFVVDESDPKDPVILVRLVSVDGKGSWKVGEI